MLCCRLACCRLAAIARLLRNPSSRLSALTAQYLAGDSPSANACAPGKCVYNGSVAITMFLGVMLLHCCHAFKSNLLLQHCFACLFHGIMCLKAKRCLAFCAWAPLGHSATALLSCNNVLFVYVSSSRAVCRYPMLHQAETDLGWLC